MSNETLKISNKRRLSREEAKSYFNIFHLLYIHGEQWACLAFCFHTTATPTRGCSSWESKENSRQERRTGMYRNRTCTVLSHFPTPVDGLEQQHIGAGKLQPKGKIFLELVNFSLNQPAGNKASFCSLLRASARRRPGNTYSQAELERTQPLTLRILWQRSVPMSSYFYDTKRQ